MAEVEHLRNRVNLQRYVRLAKSSMTTALFTRIGAWGGITPQLGLYIQFYSSNCNEAPDAVRYVTERATSWRTSSVAKGASQ